MFGYLHKTWDKIQEKHQEYYNPRQYYTSITRLLTKILHDKILKKWNNRTSYIHKNDNSTTNQEKNLCNKLREIYLNPTSVHNSHQHLYSTFTNDEISTLSIKTLQSQILAIKGAIKSHHLKTSYSIRSTQIT